jgi:amino acid adenylation domain-containing protein
LSSDVCLHEVIRRQAVAQPDAPAVALESQTVNYRDLDAISDHVATRLVERGVAAEDRIAIWATRGVETVIAVLATLKAGACCVLLDETVPPQRRSHIIDRARVGLILASEADDVPQLDITCMRLRYPDVVSDHSVSASVHPDNLAYIIHTSGSTGKPKGVALSHRAFVEAIRANAAVTGVGPGDRVLLLAPVTFDVWCLEFFSAMLTGACLQVLPRALTTPGPELVRALREHETTWAVLVPSVLKVLPRDRLPRLRTIICGGEPLPAELARHWGRERQLFNMYGLTECSVASSYHRVLEDQQDPVPIGRRLASAVLHVLDDDLEPAATGVQGGLLIGGPSLARGYLADPAQTAERFLPDPSGDGARVYRTGDVVRRTAAGDLEFVGRLDHQVKVRGVRIELGEVEGVVRAHPAVADVAVVAVARGDETVLVAHVVPGPGGAPTAAELRDFLRQRLPETMVPSETVFTAALPHSDHGKVDRRALAQTSAPPEAPVAAVGPEDDAMVAALAGVVVQLLKRDRVGPDDNIFEFGIHSLLAARLAVVVRDVFGVEIDVGSVLRAPTVRELSALVQERKQATLAGPL